MPIPKDDSKAHLVVACHGLLEQPPCTSQPSFLFLLDVDEDTTVIGVSGCDQGSITLGLGESIPCVSRVGVVAIGSIERRLMLRR